MKRLNEVKNLFFKIYSSSLIEKDCMETTKETGGKIPSSSPLDGFFSSFRSIFSGEK